MNRENYTIVIPTFNDKERLELLIEDIHNESDLYPACKLIIVDDCSTDDTKYIPKLFDTEDLPIQYIKLPTQQGPLVAEKTGIEEVETEMFVVLHSDIRLNIQNIYTEEIQHIIKHPIDKIICYLKKGRELRGINIGVVAPFTLQVEKPYKIQSGPRSLGVDLGVPYSMYRSYRFMSLARSKYHRFESVHSVDGCCYAMMKNAYDEAGGINENYSPYLFYHDDLFGRVRQEGYRIYSTTETAVFHPSIPNKDKQSLSRPNPELFDRNKKKFIDDWKNKMEIWDFTAPLNLYNQKFLRGSDRG